MRCLGYTVLFHTMHKCIGYLCAVFYKRKEIIPICFRKVSNDWRSKSSASRTNPWQLSQIYDSVIKGGTCTASIEECRV